MFDKILPRKTFVKGSRLLAGLWHCKISCLAKLLFQRVSLGLYQRNIDNKGVDDKKVNVRAVKQLKSPLRERRKCLESILLSVCAKETKMPNKKRENKRKSKVARFRSGRTHTRIDYGQTKNVDGRRPHPTGTLLVLTDQKRNRILSFYQVFPLFRWFMHFSEV